MKTKSYSVTTLCMVIAIVSVLFLSQSSAYGGPDYPGSISIWVSNRDALHRTATDLHFTVHLPNWLGQQPGPIYILPNQGPYEWEILMDPYWGPPLGTPTITPWYNSAEQIYAFDVTYAPITVPYGNPSWPDYWLLIKAWVAGVPWYPSYPLVIDSLRWSYFDDPIRVDVCPRWYSQFMILGNKKGYAFYNTDSLYDLQLNYLQFSWDSVWYEPKEQWDTIGTQIGVWTGPLVLHPGDSLYVPLDSIPDNPNSYIYVAGEMEYQMPDCDYAVSQFRLGHQATSSMAIPTLTEWGLIIFGVLLVLSLIWVIRKRIKKATVTA